MPIEALENVVAISDDVFSQTTAPAGNVSVWCVAEGASADGFKSEDQVIQQGLPFGHGSRNTVRGFKRATIKGADGKMRPNIVNGPSGRKYVELYVDEESMKAKQVFEANISNQAVKNAQGSVRTELDPNDNEIKASVTGCKDEFKKLTDDEIDQLNEKRLREITKDAP